MSGIKNCSEFDIKVLKAIASSRGNVNASWLAEKMWPDAKGKCFGARSGRWQRMGAILQSLNNRGLVWREVTEHNQKLWTISTRGRSVIREMDRRNDGWVELPIASGIRMFAKPISGTYGERGIVRYEHELPDDVREYFRREIK